MQPSDPSLAARLLRDLQECDQLLQEPQMLQSEFYDSVATSAGDMPVELPE